MASEAISEHLIFKIFLGGMPPDPPSLCVLTHAFITHPPQWPYQIEFAVSGPVRCNLLSLSSGVSAAILLVHGYFFCCNLSLSSRVLAAILFAFTGTFCRLQPGLSLFGSLNSQSVPSCCSRIVYMLYH